MACTSVPVSHGAKSKTPRPSRGLAAFWSSDSSCPSPPRPPPPLPSPRRWAFKRGACGGGCMGLRWARGRQSIWSPCRDIRLSKVPFERMCHTPPGVGVLHVPPPPPSSGAAKAAQSTERTVAMTIRGGGDLVREETCLEKFRTPNSGAIFPILFFGHQVQNL